MSTVKQRAITNNLVCTSNGNHYGAKNPSSKDGMETIQTAEETTHIPIHIKTSRIPPSYGFPLDRFVRVNSTLITLEKFDRAYHKRFLTYERNPFNPEEEEEFYDIKILHCPRSKYDWNHMILQKFYTESGVSEWVLRGYFDQERAQKKYREKIKEKRYSGAKEVELADKDHMHTYNPFYIPYSQPGLSCCSFSQIDPKYVSCQVDYYCPIKTQTRVFRQDSHIMEAKFHMSNIRRNSNNFYICQILQSLVDKSAFYVFYRYGRTGKSGEWVLRGTYGLNEATEIYDRKIASLSRKPYKRIDLVYAADESDVIPKAYDSQIQNKTVNKEVLDLLDIIPYKSKIIDPLSQQTLDREKLPLGKLSMKMTTEALIAGKKLREAIKQRAQEDEIIDLNSQFFTSFPQDVQWRYFLYFNSFVLMKS